MSKKTINRIGEERINNFGSNREAMYNYKVEIDD